MGSIPRVWVVAVCLGLLAVAVPAAVLAASDADEAALDAALEEWVRKTITALQEGNVEARRNAAGTLGRMRSVGPEVVTALIAAFEDRDAEVRIAVVDALGRHGKDAATVLPVLRRALEDPHRYVRHVAVYAITRAQFRPLAEEDVLLFAERLDDANESVRSAACDAASRLGKAGAVAMPLFVEALGRRMGPMNDIVTSVTRMGLEREVAREFLETALMHADEKVRERAAFQFSAFHPLSEEEVRRLAELVGDPSPGVRHSAARAILYAGPHRKIALPALCDALHLHVISPRPVGRMGPEAAAAVDGLRDCLLAAKTSRRARAAEALGAMGPAARSAVSELVAALVDEQPSVRAAAAYALGDLGELAGAAAPDVEKALTDVGEKVVSAACYAMFRITGDADKVLPILEGQLGGKDVSTARRAAYVAGVMGVKARSMIPILIASARDGEWQRQ